MAGKFNKKIRYQKKYFNIYKKIIPEKVKPGITNKNQKLKFKDLDPKLKNKFAVESKPSFFDDLFNLFKF